MGGTALTKMSSRGQIVIPQEIRNRLGLDEKAILAVATEKDMIMLKKVPAPEIKSWREATKPFQEAAKKSQFTKKDLDSLLASVRQKK